MQVQEEFPEAIDQAGLHWAWSPLLDRWLMNISLTGPRPAADVECQRPRAPIGTLAILMPDNEAR